MKIRVIKCCIYASLLNVAEPWATKKNCLGNGISLSTCGFIIEYEHYHLKQYTHTQIYYKN